MEFEQQLAENQAKNQKQEMDLENCDNSNQRTRKVFDCLDNMKLDSNQCSQKHLPDSQSTKSMQMTKSSSISKQKQNKKTEEDIKQFLAKCKFKKRLFFIPWQKFEIEKYVQCLKNLQEQQTLNELSPAQIYKIMNHEMNKDYKRYRTIEDIRHFHEKMIRFHRSFDNIIANAVKRFEKEQQTKQKKVIRTKSHSIAQVCLDKKKITNILKKSYNAYLGQFTNFSRQDLLFQPQTPKLTIQMRLTIKEKKPKASINNSEGDKNIILEQP